MGAEFTVREHLSAYAGRMCILGLAVLVAVKEKLRLVKIKFEG